jgi:uncharacterized protein (DUF697 family)/tellurite resistance protein
MPTETKMTEQENKAVMTIALMAAFADGLKDERERAAVKQVADALGAQGGVDLPALYREALIAKPDLAQLATMLQTQESRQLAYEMAVGVCDADGAHGAAEKEFLGRLAKTLNLPATVTGDLDRRADEMARAASDDTTQSSAAPVTGPVLGKASVPDAEMDQMIRKAAITNAALELLPEGLSSMAIIPLQMRLVYRIGKAYGYELDRDHTRDFIATIGVGLTSQYLEQFGRKLLGGLLGSLGGGLGRTLGRQTASSGLTFATTYALGRVAQRYYAGGRKLDAAALKSTFSEMLVEARGLAPRYRDEIEQRAQAINPRELASLIRGV